MLTCSPIRLRRGLLPILVILMTSTRLPAPIQEPEPSSTPSVTPEAQPHVTKERATNLETHSQARTQTHRRDSQTPQSIPTQTQPNSRIDGTWVGTETVRQLSYESNLHRLEAPQRQ